MTIDKGRKQIQKCSRLAVEMSGEVPVLCRVCPVPVEAGIQFRPNKAPIWSGDTTRFSVVVVQLLPNTIATDLVLERFLVRPKLKLHDAEACGVAPIFPTRSLRLKLNFHDAEACGVAPIFPTRSLRQKLNFHDAEACGLAPSKKGPCLG